MRKLQTGIAAVSGLLLLGVGAVSLAQDPKPFIPKIRGVPVLLIQRVEQIDNLDQGDPLGKNRADFYAVVNINGIENKTPVYVEDDAWPYWEIPMDMRTRYSNVTVDIMEDDGGLERKDDHVDICPEPLCKTLRFRYDRETGKITGDIEGRKDQVFVLEGKGDDDRARITFKVHKA